MEPGETVILNVATHAHYPAYQQRLLASLDRYAPGIPRCIWTGALPSSWPPHQAVPYGFKLHAIKNGIAQSFRYLVWLDSDVELASPIEPFMERVKEQGYYLYKGDSPLWQYCRQDVMDHYQITPQERDDIKILGGKIIALDTAHAAAMGWLDGLTQAMNAGFYDGTVSASSGKQDHRGDEAIGAILARRLGMQAEDYKRMVVGDVDMPCPPGIFRSGRHLSVSSA